MKHYGNRTRQHVFVINGLTMNLLLLPAIQALKIISKIDSISRSRIVRKVNFVTARRYNTVIHNAFPKLFPGLGNLGKEYEISLNPDAKSFSLTAPKCVPFPPHKNVSNTVVRGNGDCSEEEQL